MTPTNPAPERLVTAVSTHWVKYLPRGILCHLLLLTGVAVWVTAFVAGTSIPVVTLMLAIIGIILVLSAHHMFFHLLMSEELLDIIVTNRRIVYFDDCLFLCDDEHEIPLRKITGVQVRQHGLLQNLLDYGVLWIDTGGGPMDLKRTIPNVPHPDEMASIIARIVHAEGDDAFS